MNEIVKIGLVAGGAYLVSKYVFGYDPLASLVGSSVVPTSVAPSGSPQANNPNAAMQANTFNQVVIALKAAGVDVSSYQTFDTWNFYYQKVRGIPGPDPGGILSATDRMKNISLNEWWGYMTGAGFSGMGMLAHHVNPYRNPRGTPFGDNLQPSGTELYVKRFTN